MNSVLPLTHDLNGDIRDQVAKFCEIAQNFDVFGPPNFGGGKGPPKFLTDFMPAAMSLPFSMRLHSANVKSCCRLPNAQTKWR